MSAKSKTWDRLSRRSVRRFKGAESWVLSPITGQPIAAAHVTSENALTYPPVLSAICAIAMDIMSLNLGVFRRKPDGGNEPAIEHPAHRLLSMSPDGGMTTSRKFRLDLMGHILRGNGYAEILRLEDGQTLHKLRLMDPKQTIAKLGEDDQVWYHTVDFRRQPIKLPYSKVIHVSGLGNDGISGYDIIGLIRQAIALGKAAEIFGAKFFESGTNLGGYFKFPRKIGDPERKRFEQMVKENHQGLANAFSNMVLTEGGEYVKLGSEPENAQYNETRYHQTEDSTRPFRTPPHKIGDYRNAHLANINAANIDYLETVIMPWCTLIEAELNIKLFTEQEQRIYYVKHNLNARLRGNPELRSLFYKTLFYMGAISPNDIRAWEELDPIPAKEGGNTYFYPVNMQRLADAAKTPKK